MKFKYENQINDILKEIYYEDWMDEFDYEEFLKDNFNLLELKQKLSDNIETGVKNCYTVEQQIELLKKQLKQ